MTHHTLLVATDLTPESVEYLDAVQNVYTNSNKVMVDVEGGNNMMYLPLDKLGAGGSSVRRSQTLEINSGNLRQLTDAVTEQILRDNAAKQSRRGGR